MVVSLAGAKPMPTTSCPKCNAALEFDESLAGGLVACPFCREVIATRPQFISPTLEAPPLAVQRTAIAPRPSPVAIQVNLPDRSPRPEPTSRNRDWLIRAVVVGAVATAAIVGTNTAIDQIRIRRAASAIQTLTAPSREAERENARETIKAFQMAARTLAKFDCSEISEDSRAGPSNDDETQWAIAGHTKRKGQMIPFGVVYQRLQFGDKTTWDVQLIKLDGEIVYAKDSM